MWIKFYNFYITPIYYNKCGKYRFKINFKNEQYRFTLDEKLKNKFENIIMMYDEIWFNCWCIKKCSGVYKNHEYLYFEICNVINVDYEKRGGENDI